jgi:serine/threonine protein kinase
VVHRDLSLANILVESDGETPQPKILDFGVARATHSDIQQVTMHTEVGQIVGTLSYMSPEQVAGRPDELDVRSVVFALGVILFELLADRLPYDLRGHSIPEVGSIIREQEPSRLSSVHSAFRGDIETIVAKALEKEKERRYQSASELADDIRRFLRDEPIVARPSSRAYQIRNSPSETRRSSVESWPCSSRSSWESLERASPWCERLTPKPSRSNAPTNLSARPQRQPR